MCGGFCLGDHMTREEKYIKLTLKEAQKALLKDEVPIGCVIVKRTSSFSFTSIFENEISAQRGQTKITNKNNLAKLNKNFFILSYRPKIIFLNNNISSIYY